MSSVSFNRKRVKLKQLLGIRARLALLAVILVAPLMLERARSLEDNRARQIAQASQDFANLTRHSADTQREVISSVQTVLKSAAYIRASAGGLSRTCDILRASVPANMPWIRNILLVGGDGRVQCSTGNSYVGLYLGDRPYIKKAQATHDFVVSDFLLARGGNNAVVMAAYPVSAINPLGQAILNLYPSPNTPGTLTYNYIFQYQVGYAKPEDNVYNGKEHRWRCKLYNCCNQWYGAAT